MNKIKKTRKSHLLIFGSFLVFIGFLTLSWNYLLRMKNEVYSDMQIEMSDAQNSSDQRTLRLKVPISNNLPDDSSSTADDTPVVIPKPIDYSKYLGVLEIPRIGLKRGFFDVDNYYNNISYNVTLVRGSTMPDVENGNLVLMAHSGDAYISYFAFLYRLEIGDVAYVTYGGNRYFYRIVDIYTVPKVGVVRIRRNLDRTCMTLITCTKNDDTTQTVYILERE